MDDWATSNCKDIDDFYLAAGRETVRILQQLNVDECAELAGYFCAFQGGDGGIERYAESIKEQFGSEVLQLSCDVSRMRELSDQLQSESLKSQSSVNEENFRKMLITMVDDPRVVLIGLASQLNLLRQCKNQNQEIKLFQSSITRDVYAPLANRLGVWQLKWELEDLSFRYLQPITYKNLATALEEKRQDREKYISLLIEQIKTRLKDQGINADVQGRPKHIYSIWKKMQRKSLEFKQLWDLRGIRILVDSIDDCYAALSVVHSNWNHLADEYSDYVATPKENGYQSIHTVINGEDDKAIEVQIRTYEMHQESELGVAAHWRYKEAAQSDMSLDNKVVWLRQLLEWKDEILDSSVVKGRIESRSKNQRVYVFTPKGTVIDLPVGSTPIDFAYAVHTEVGHRTRGAKINGKMVPLNYELQTGEQITIQTVKSGGPSRDWLRKDNPYIQTSRARNRILQWFKREDYDQYVSEGRSMLERELHRLGLDDLSYEKINHPTHFHSVDDLLAAIGAHDYKLSKALSPFKTEKLTTVDSLPIRTRRPVRKGKSSGFTIQGVGNLLNHLANCCQPVPGDKIIGFITRGKGVSIHRKSCINILNLDPDLENRLIDVEWGEDTDNAYTLSLRVIAYQRSGLLHDITEVLKSVDVDVLKVNMETDKEHVTNLNLHLELAGQVRPATVMAKLNGIQNVLEVKREL